MTGYKHYRGRQVEGASPLGLLLLTYEVLVQSLTRARLAAESGNIEIQTEQTTRAMEALLELISSLDHEKGGEIADHLSSLYVYMYRRMMEGQDEHIVASLDEVMRLAQTLREGWQDLARQQENTQGQDNRIQAVASLAVAA